MNKTTHTTAAERRARLLHMVSGADGSACLYFYIAGYTLICTDERSEDKPALFSLPLDDDGRRLYLRFAGAAVPGARRGGAANIYAAWEYYGDDASADDIADAMKQRPCLANYGGTLRAINPDANGQLCFIVKDMQA